MASACTQTHVVLEPVAVSIGDAHTCVVAGRALYCWGKNDHGQLGLGDTKEYPTAKRVGKDADWLAVATGSDSSLALKVDGTIWSFGGNDSGQLGLGEPPEHSEPEPRQITDPPVLWTAIATRFTHACALARDRSLWCWGNNSEGQLGQNDPAPPSSMEDCRAPSTDSVCRNTPTQVTTLTDVFAVDTGQGHTCAIKTDGTLWCWGRNTYSELSRPKPPDQIRRPVQIESATDWTVVRSGQDTNCGVGGGVVQCWGASFAETAEDTTGWGIPGVPADTSVSMPKVIGAPTGVVDLSFNTFGGAVVDDKGGAWLWGRNLEGQFGLGDMMSRSGLARAKGSGWTQLSVGRFSNCGVLDGRPVCTGKNDFGQLGQGSNISRSSNFVVVRLPPY